MNTGKTITACIILSLALSAAGAENTAVAFLGAANSGGDQRYDYLGPLISGLVLYDLSTSRDVTLVDRASLDAVLCEQEISMSLGKGDAVKLGEILGARYIVKAEYGVIGAEVSLTLSLVDAQSSQASAFTDRGSDENLVHALAERLVKKLTGNDEHFRSEQRKRSLLSLKDVTPGSLNLHCGLVNAEVFLDGEFAGYTTGDVKVPFKIENLDPGSHAISVKLRGFGIVKLPEVSYRDWDKTVEILPGKNAVVKADIRLFSDWYNEIRELKRIEFRLAPGAGKDSKEGRADLSFTGRDGKAHAAAISYRAGLKAEGGSVSASLSFDGQPAQLELTCGTGKDAEGATDGGPLRLTAEIDMSGVGRGDFSLAVTRTDISDDEWN